MTANKRGSKQNERKQGKSNPFIQLELTTTQAAECKAAAFGADDLDNYCIKRTEGGYKITVRYDDYNSCFAAWCVAPDDVDDTNSGKILSGRGSTPLKALKQLAYKDFAILGGVWPMTEKSAAQEIDD